MRNLMLTSAIALVLGVAGSSAWAQGQPKPDESKNAPHAQGAPKGGSAAQPRQSAPPAARSGPARAEPRAAQGTENRPKSRNAQAPSEKSGRGTAESQPKQKSTKGTAETQPKQKSTRGTAETQPKQKSTRGTAETQPKGKNGGTASDRTGGKANQTTGEAPKGSTGEAPKASANAPAGGQPRVQVSEQQRTSINRTVLREPRVNRATNAHFTIRVGERIPRSVRLAVLPAAVLAIVPAYRSYDYVVVDDEVLIVEPSTYEIVDVFPASGQIASGGVLVLTDTERDIVLAEIEPRRASTLGIGVMVEGADVPRSVEVHAMPDTVVRRVSKLRGYKYFTAENRIAIVGPQGEKIRLVIERP